MIPEWLAAHADIQLPCPHCGTNRPRRDFTQRTLQEIQKFSHWFLLSDHTCRRAGFMQKLDPRVKLAGLIGWLLIVTCTHRWDSLAALYAVILGFALLSRIPLGRFLSRTWLLISLFSVFLAMPAILNLVTPGDTIWTMVRFQKPLVFGWWHFPEAITITRQGVLLASILILRSANAVSWTLLIVLTTPWEKLLGALRMFRIPQAMVMTIGVMVRYLHLLFREVEESHLAIQSRILHTPRTKTGQRMVSSRAGALLQKTLKLGENVYQAMCSRGYTGEFR